MRKTVTAAAMAASLTIGGAAGAALFVPSLSGAQESDATTETTPADDSSRAEKRGRLAEVLAPLVEDGTITQAQADAVIAALQEARPERGDRFGGPKALLEVLGVTAEDLRAAFQDGKSIADVAVEQGVSVDDVVAALVAEAQERIATGVENGRLTDDEAATKLSAATDRITAFVNGDLEPGDFGPRRGHRGHHGPGGDEAPADAGTTDS